MYLYLAIFAISFLITYVMTPSFIKKLRLIGYVGVDVNKKGKPKVTQPGGFTIVFGIIFSLLLYIGYATFFANADTLNILAAITTILIICLIGILEDFLKIKRAIKAFTPLAAAIPLIVLKIGETTMSIPFFGSVNFGTFYLLVLIPIAITGASNAINMSAGYNGVEVGQALIISFFLFIISYMSNALAAAVIFASLVGACLAFLFFNWYPAKTFPGDVGTLSLGAAIAAAVIIGNIEKYGFILFLPAFYELATTIYWKLSKSLDAGRKLYMQVKLDDSNRLIIPKKDKAWTQSTFFTILNIRPMTERNLVLTVLSIYFVMGLIVLALFFFNI
ncbi:MAG: hypothetical protein U9P44_00140 [archaeon]|nr:hypothetical protein [archaeon]